LRILAFRFQKLENRKDRALTPLLYAARNGHEAVVRLLLDSKVDVNAKAEHFDGTTALS
jgi:ankyrin repeat protein